MKILFIEALPTPRIEKQCVEQSCKNSAQNRVVMGKRGGLFQFYFNLCEVCTNQAKKVIGLER